MRVESCLPFVHESNGLRRDLTDAEVDMVTELNEATVTQGSVLLGLVGLVDPIRPEVPAAIASCHKAGSHPLYPQLRNAEAAVY